MSNICYILLREAFKQKISNTVIMKNFKLILNLTIVVTSFMFFQCTSEYTPIAGADGKDGIDGSNADAALCITCHSSSHRDPIINAYESSGHGSGSSWARGTSASCAQCHNNEGYLDYLSGRFFKTDDTGDYLEDVNGDPIPTVNPDGYAVSNPISCTGCHDAHRSFDFENDGNDYAVRNIDPVKLDLDPTIVVDFSNSADPLGLSNACITCHQPRTSYAIPTGTADYEITSSRFGPHHGPQATLYEGIMGANIAGSEGYPGVASSTHRTGASCTSCHMGESTEVTQGGHTWVPSEDACITCHTNGVPSEVSGYAADFQTLHDLLLAEGAITATGSTVSGTYPVKVAQAVWNYKTLEEDKSNGVHNPAYAKALLKNSIEALNN